MLRQRSDNQLSSSTLLLRTSAGDPFYPLYYFDAEALNFSNGQQTIPVTPIKLSRGEMFRLPALPVPACHGLILIVPVDASSCWDYRIIWDPKRSMEIRNPITHERLKLPQPKPKSKQVLGVGIGYDRAADDYKVVLIYYNGESYRQTHVYSLKSDSWRKGRDCLFRFSSQDVTQHGVYLNGALHWVSDDGIIALEVGTENYRQLALPKKPESKSGPMQLAALGGCLFLSYFGGGHYREYFDVWVMNDDCGGRDSWMKLFSLNRHHVPSQIFYRHRARLVAYMEKERRVLLHDQNDHGFLWFDIDTDSVKAVDIDGICEYSGISAQICLGSLFRIHESCGRDASETRMNQREMMEMADTKLTFCVRDVDTSARSDLFNFPCEGHQVHSASFNPDGDPILLSVPLDICREVFIQLPAKSLIRFRAVCKAYRDVIDTSDFVKSHTVKQISSNNTVLVQSSTGPPSYPIYSFDLDQLNLTDCRQKITATPHNLPRLVLPQLGGVTVCNGLILFVGRNKWEIWNPLTDERLELPQGDFRFSPDVQSIGFGYDYATDDYKVVGVGYMRQWHCGKKVYQTHVYSLRSDSWRIMIGNCPFHDLSYPMRPGVFVSGALNWLPTEWDNNKIIALDLGTESYKQLGYPPFRESEIRFEGRRCLGVLDGCLIMSDDHIAYDDDNMHFDVWAMKDYGVEGSWVKLFSIKEKPGVYNHLRPVAYMREKTQIFLQDYFYGFFLFDIERCSMRKVSIRGLTRNLHARAIPESIFRLHDNCGVSTQRRRIVKVSDAELNLCVRPHEVHMTVDIV